MRCTTYARIGVQYCSQHLIYLQELEELVLQAIQANVNEAIQSMDFEKIRQQKLQTGINDESSRLEMQLEQLERNYRKMIMNLSQELISIDDFNVFKTEYTAQKKMIENRKKILQKQKDTGKIYMDEYQRWLETFLQHREIKELSREYEGNFLFEYSPESFTGTEPEYAVEVCNAVLDVMQPTPDRPMIINLPVTVEMSMPHIYANQIEWCSKHLKYRDAVVLSTHPHNDRGCGVADAELAVLAGAQRVECCLFGNGERTGNVDAITLAMNMYSHGVDPKLDFSDMPAICEVYERVTRMHVYERSPYAGSLVFAAFSGSHQDAIAKGMTYRKEHHQHRWDCPYIPIDPHDISRTYDADVIRINSQSGKGGIGFLLQQNYGYNPPPHMREQLGYRVKEVSDHDHRELSVQEVLEVFEDNYVNNAAPLNVTAAHYTQNQDGSISANLTLRRGSRMIQCGAAGNGRLDAVANAIEQAAGMDFTLIHYSEHALDPDTDSRACSYVGLKWPDGRETWGCGTHTDIIVAGVRALVSAINNR